MPPPFFQRKKVFHRNFALFGTIKKVLSGHFIFGISRRM
jgi:hypothetical protein